MATIKKIILYIFVALLTVIIAITLFVVVFIQHPKFGAQPSGERLDRIKNAPNYYYGRFNNSNVAPLIVGTKKGGRLRGMYNFLFEERYRNRPDTAIKAIKSDLHSLDSNENLLVWFGHSSLMLQIDGVRILVDPVLCEAAPLKILNRPFKGSDIYSPKDIPSIDYLLITHDHWDHLDYNTVMEIKERVGKVICPLGVGAHFEHWGFEKDHIIELYWDEDAILGNGCKVYALEGRHFSGRTFKSNQTLWASFLIETPSKKIYVSGDGGYDAHFKRIGERFKDIDIAIMENGQFNTQWRYTHLLPEHLIAAIKDIGAKKVFAFHNSKFALAKHQWDEPLDNIAAMDEELNINIPSIGQIVNLDDSATVRNIWWK